MRSLAPRVRFRCGRSIWSGSTAINSGPPFTSSYCCRGQPLAATSLSSLPRTWQTSWHNIHTTASLCKSKKVEAKPSKIEDEIQNKNTFEAISFQELDDSLIKATEKLRDSLSKLRGGGKFNTRSIEGLRVQPDKKSAETVRLDDLAQCIPRGRVLNVIVGDKDYVKPVSSAILSSDLNLTPQTDAQNPLQINIQLPPPTTESRQADISSATKSGEQTTNAIRNLRQTQQKKLKAQKKDIRPDEFRKLEEKMEKKIKDATTEVKRVLDGAKKALES